jgi:uncharacterized protein
VRQKIRRVAAGLIAFGLVANGCGGKRADSVPIESSLNGGSCTASSGRITIATGNVGGVYYVVGGRIAQLINENTDLDATAAQTGGSAQNIQQLVNGNYDIALAGAAEIYDAAQGRGFFAGKPQQVQALTRLYPEYVHVLVRADAGIDSIADLEGRRVSTGSPKSGTEAFARRLLQAADLDPKEDIQAQRLDLSRAADGFKSGAIDALVWFGGLPSGQIAEITASMRGEVKFLDVSAELEELKKANPMYEEDAIPAGVYHQPTDVPTIVEQSVLLVRADFPASVACASTKLMFQKKDELAEAHPAAEQILLSEARQIYPLTLHPGASRALDMLAADPATPRAARHGSFLPRAWQETSVITVASAVRRAAAGSSTASRRCQDLS